MAITEQEMPLNEGLPAGRYKLRLGLVRQSRAEPVEVAADAAKATGLILRQVEVR